MLKTGHLDSKHLYLANNWIWAVEANWVFDFEQHFTWLLAKMIPIQMKSTVSNSP